MNHKFEISPRRGIPSRYWCSEKNANPLYFSDPSPVMYNKGVIQSALEFLTAIAIPSRTHRDTKSFPFDDEESAYPPYNGRRRNDFPPES